MDKEQLFRELYQSLVERNAYTDSIPREFDGVVFDNPYANSLGMDLEKVMDFAFGEHAEAISWFFYEWKPGFCCGDVKINSIDDYIDYMKANEGF